MSTSIQKLKPLLEIAISAIVGPVECTCSPVGRFQRIPDAAYGRSAVTYLHSGKGAVFSRPNRRRLCLGKAERGPAVLCPSKTSEVVWQVGTRSGELRVWRRTRAESVRVVSGRVGGGGRYEAEPGNVVSWRWGAEIGDQEVKKSCDGGEQQQQVDRVYLQRVAGAKVCRSYLARPFWPHRWPNGS